MLILYCLSFAPSTPADAPLAALLFVQMGKIIGGNMEEWGVDIKERVVWLILTLPGTREQEAARGDGWGLVAVDALRLFLGVHCEKVKIIVHGYWARSGALAGITKRSSFWSVSSKISEVERERGMDGVEAVFLSVCFPRSSSWFMNIPIRPSGRLQPGYCALSVVIPLSSSRFGFFMTEYQGA